MVDDVAIQLALRGRLLTLSVVTTGSISLSATATGYARATGSFLTDGFAPGMEITPSGFVSNPVDVLTGVTATTLTTKNTRTVEAAAGGRIIAVGLPARRGWENIALQPVAGMPYVEEDYLPGPAQLRTLGPSGTIEILPQYVVRLFGPQNVGIGALGKYAQAILALFAPKTAIAVGSNTLRVRGDVAPLRGQLLQDASGWAVIPVNIPLRLETLNSL